MSPEDMKYDNFLLEQITHQIMNHNEQQYCLQRRDHCKMPSSKNPTEMKSLNTPISTHSSTSPHSSYVTIASCAARHSVNVVILTGTSNPTAGSKTTNVRCADAPCRVSGTMSVICDVTQVSGRISAVCVATRSRAPTTGTNTANHRQERRRTSVRYAVPSSTSAVT